MVVPFDVKKATELTTDASENAIVGILSQEGHPVMYMSRRLSTAERNYSNIEREALAIVWSTFRARHFLVGSKFTLRSDHRPLEFIFNPRRELPKVTSARLLRWAIQLMAFDYEVYYVKGDSIPHVDALSRLTFEDDNQTQDIREESFVHWTGTDVLNMPELQMATNNDSVLPTIKKRIQCNKWSNCSQAERPFKSIRSKLTVEDDVVYNGDIIVVPHELRRKFISSIHDDIHGGVTATKHRLRLEAWWPGYGEDIERYVKNCVTCQRIKPISQNNTHTWPKESEPWSRVHMDHGHVPGIGSFLILVDSYSGWPEAIMVNDRSSQTVQKVLRTVFSRNGVPRSIVSDNAAEFTDGNLCAWLQKIGCSVIKTPPYHPASNGIAERMVQTIKRGIKAFLPNSGTFDAFLAKLLLSYRSIPHGERNKSPSALMGRQLRCPLTMSFTSDAPLWFVPKPGALAEKANFIVQAGSNTALITRGERGTLAHLDQIRSRTITEQVDEDNGQIVNQNPEGNNDLEESKDNTLVEVRKSLRANKGVPPTRYGYESDISEDEHLSVEGEM